jgi:3-hydroxyisobutyrate dehydrogenase
MALRLLAAGYDVLVWNRTRAKLQPVLARGGREVASPAALAHHADIVLLRVTDAAAAEEITFGENGLVEGIGAGKVAVDFSSIRPDATRAIAKQFRSETGSSWVDAPVSGGVPGAEQGTLTIVCGGDTADVERIRPVVMHLCQRCTHMGDSGAGQLAKLCNQVIVGSTLAVLAEAVNLAQHAGVDASRLPEALQGGFADSLLLQLFGPRMAARDFEPPLGEIAAMIKDLDTATNVAALHRAALPMTTTAAELLRLCAGLGHAHDDVTAIINLFGESPP